MGSSELLLTPSARGCRTIVFHALASDVAFPVKAVELDRRITVVTFIDPSTLITSIIGFFDYATLTLNAAHADYARRALSSLIIRGKYSVVEFDAPWPDIYR